MIFDNSIIAHLISDPEYSKQTGFVPAIGRGVSVVPVLTGWDILHGYNPTEWNQAAAKLFMDQFSDNHVPLNCDCRAHWREYITKRPPVFSSSLGFAVWGWNAHQSINRRLDKEGFSWRSFLLRYRPGLMPQQAETTEILAVTSLAPLRIERQAKCLESWRKVGLQIAAVNSQTEIDAIAEYFPQVAQWIAVESERFPRINSLLDVAASEETPILLINADIEIYGNQSRLLSLVANRKNAIGLRHNYEDYPTDATREPCGLDAFLVYPEQASRLSRVALTIGKPLWDYWLAKELTDTSHCEWIDDPYFYHHTHPVVWTDDDRTAALNSYSNQFGQMDWAEWRNRFRGND